MDQVEEVIILTSFQSKVATNHTLVVVDCILHTLGCSDCNCNLKVTTVIHIAIVANMDWDCFNLKQGYQQLEVADQLQSSKTVIFSRKKEKHQKVPFASAEAI